MNKDSSTCGDPACEGMSVTIQVGEGRTAP